MKRVAAGAHLSTLWLFAPAKRPDNTVESNTVSSARSSLVQAPGTRFLQLSGRRRAMMAKSGGGSAQSVFPANAHCPVSIVVFPLNVLR